MALNLSARVNLNPFGDTLEGQAQLLLPTRYRHKGMLLGYGLKFWPLDLRR